MAAFARVGGETVRTYADHSSKMLYFLHFTDNFEKPSQEITEAARDKEIVQLVWEAAASLSNWQTWARSRQIPMSCLQ